MADIVSSLGVEPGIQGITPKDSQTTTPSPKSDKDTLLAKIKEVTQEHDAIANKFTTLTTGPTSNWQTFGKEVDAASDKLKEAVALLAKYKGPTVTPGAGDNTANEAVFGEYGKLYTAITKALVNGEGKINPEVATGNFESLIFTKGFTEVYADSNTEETPINKFIMAIKDSSFNSSASKIQLIENLTSEEGSKLNHALLKAVLDALATESVKGYLSNPTPPKELAALLTTLTPMFTETNSSLRKEINEKYETAITPISGTQVGGSSSSSSSKKNRKSHKSYHPDIGKTRKHHYNADHKRVSFVHQA